MGFNLFLKSIFKVLNCYLILDVKTNIILNQITNLRAIIKSRFHGEGGGSLKRWLDQFWSNSAWWDFLGYIFRRKKLIKCIYVLPEKCFQNSKKLLPTSIIPTFWTEKVTVKNTFLKMVRCFLMKIKKRTRCALHICYTSSETQIKSDNGFR